MRVRRVALPQWVTRGPTPSDPDPDWASTGEQIEWGVAIPWLFRALAAPDADNVMLEPPRPGDDLSTATAYWCPLVHLLVYSLGWRRPDLGLRWWYDAGQPVDDPRFKLITDVWGADGQLDWFAAWLWTEGMSQGIGRAAVDGEISPTHPRPGVIDRRWVDEQRRAAELWGGPSPLVGGSDPLHLRDHWRGPVESTPSSPYLLRSESGQRRAVLMLDSMVGWYRVLSEQMRALPVLGDRSWHVDVVVKPAGWLGTYRHSRATGRCFAGRHRFHSVGS